MRKHAMSGLARIRIQHAQAADQHGHLRRGQGQQLRAVHQQFLGGGGMVGAAVVAEAVGGRLQHGEGVDIGLLL